ncbi:MAG TPA: hypothetical protein GX503_03630 [Clostridiales bacterium]|nr:hypothetical protein [Clostridiales bacterium]
MQDMILREVVRIVIPFIQIFSFYVIFHGHLSPGGGFSGGTVLGASFILYRIVNGREKANQRLPNSILMRVLCGSLIFYGILKGYSFITGGSGIHAPQLPLGEAGRIFSAGYLLPLNIAVGMIVSVTMYFLFILFDEGEI